MKTLEETLKKEVDWMELSIRSARGLEELHIETVGQLGSLMKTISPAEYRQAKAVEDGLHEPPFEDSVIRLREVIKRAEMSGCIPRNGDSCCPWCKALVEEDDNLESLEPTFEIQHEPDCWAFYPNGQVR